MVGCHNGGKVRVPSISSMNGISPRWKYPPISCFDQRVSAPVSSNGFWINSNADCLKSIAQVFSSRPHRETKSKTFWRLYDNNACIKHWFRGNSIKQYNKTGYTIIITGLISYQNHRSKLIPLPPVI